MYRQEAKEEYLQALRQGHREYRALLAAGKNPYPAVLDKLLEGRATDSVQALGVMEIPADQIVGVKTAGRVAAFTAGFLPLLSEDSEFAYKWINLCEAHLSEGIRDPIVCYEYLGKFYVQEGNKRVSVLRHLGAPRIAAQVSRIVPVVSEEPQIRAYFEFMDFYRDSGLYQIQFRRPGDYAVLLSHLGKENNEKWEEREVRTFCAYYQYFRDAFDSLSRADPELLPEEALLLWLQLHSFQDLGKLSDKELKKTISDLWEDIQAQSLPEPVEVHTEPVQTEGRPNVLTRIMTGTPDRVNVAYVHPLDPAVSPWIKGHDLGRQHLEQVLADRVTVRSYYHADTPEQAELLLEQAVADGADVVFTTTPQLSKATLKIAVKHPKVRFLNCAMDTPYASIRTYYSRMYEAKFITGAIAGAMANNDRIGYIASAPILGETASINAFALGAQLTNPRARIVLRWSCQAGAHQADLLEQGVQVISYRDAPTQTAAYLNYGTYAFDEQGNMQAMGTPVWLWGRLYENVIRSILAGTWDKDRDNPRAVNYWWGMDSGVIDVELASSIPDGLRALSQMLRHGIQSGVLDPFRRRIVAQDGTVKNDGSQGFTPDALLHIDWLCENVEGKIPEFEEIEPFARPMVRELGLHRDKIPMEKEGTL